jgi:hypothetical protein
MFPEHPPRNLEAGTADPKPDGDDEQRDWQPHARAEPQEREREDAGVHERRGHQRPGGRHHELRDDPHAVLGRHEVAEAVHAANRLQPQLRESRPVGGDQRLDRPRILREIEGVDAAVGIH